MKSIVKFVLLLAAAPVFGQVYVLPNKGGGEITITGRPCVIKGQNHPELREAYTWSPSAPYEKGCWTIIDGMVHILFLDTNNRRVYAIEDFQKKETR